MGSHTLPSESPRRPRNCGWIRFPENTEHWLVLRQRARVGLGVYVVILVLCLRTSRECLNWATWPAPGPPVLAQFMLCTAWFSPRLRVRAQRSHPEGELFPISGRPLVLDLRNRLHEVSKAIHSLSALKVGLSVSTFWRMRHLNGIKMILKSLCFVAGDNLWVMFTRGITTARQVSSFCIDWH